MFYFFIKANFRTIAPKYFQHITINTRGDRVLDHCYSPFRDAYKSLPRPPFGKSAYRQKLKREAPALRTIQCWSDQSDAILQNCFDHVDWDMFRAASDDDTYSDSVTCFIRKCLEDVIPTKTIRIYPNQKPWINSDQPCQNKPATVNIAVSLTDELNNCYARFEADNTAHTESAPTAAAEEVSPLSLSVTDVTRFFKRVNILKAVPSHCTLLSPTWKYRTPM